MKKIIFIFFCLLSWHGNTQSLPDFQIVNASGKIVTRDSILKAKKITVINFWASWCAPCKEEMREINRFRVEQEYKNIQFVSISIDEAKGVDAAKTWFKTNKLPWKLYFDTNKVLFNKILEITENTSTAIPISIVLDENGTLRAYHSGFDLESYKLELLEDIRNINENK
jgi:peroxiredoxin